MVEILIKIPEGLKDVFENRNVTALDVEEMRNAIKNGTPLPEHHGRLIDADELLDKKQDYGEGQSTLILIDPYYVRKAPTIIEGSDSE